ncbi:IS1182 family transposase [Rhodoplanes sp. TEM]|nr:MULTISPECIES: IS1182 family transposase [Rhodoplanes]MDC7988175.1 IS1182 family transposase [Rhodoplanes sp. TEM]MDQ0359259.1 transposase [Rhodoplanes tepidamans]
MTNRPFKTGVSRAQPSLLPPSVEDYVGPDNPVRAIEAYVGALDLARLGFRHAGAVGGGAGQPPYDPADLLKLYLYGYLNQLRSSRRLEREAGRNLELIWLLHGLTPGYRTIAKFRRDNWAALKAANRSFVLVARELGLLGGTLVAIDGAFFDGNASKGSIATRKRLAAELAAIERDIEAYGAALEATDTAEADPPGGDDRGPDGGRKGGDVGREMAALMAERARRQAELDALAASGETQVSRTDADARLLTKRGHTIAGYNVQIAVDDAHKLIVASEVVDDGNDTGQLHAMAQAARDALAVETLTVVADVGYFNGDTLRACEADALTAYVPEADKNRRLAKQGRFTLKAFVYGAAEDVYVCPAGATLRPMAGHTQDAAGKRYVRYAALQSGCGACRLRARCLTDKARRREVHRWEHQDVVERHRARMAAPEADAIVRRRAALAEHPFGTLKCRAGYRHFLVRGFDRVRGEWGLMALAYNFTRVLAILGLDAFVAAMARRAAELLLFSLRRALQLAGGVGAGFLTRSGIGFARNSAVTRAQIRLAA